MHQHELDQKVVLLEHPQFLLGVVSLYEGRVFCIPARFLTRYKLAVQGNSFPIRPKGNHNSEEPMSTVCASFLLLFHLHVSGNHFLWVFVSLPHTWDNLKGAKRDNQQNVGCP